MPDKDRDLRASALFHRALISLIPALSLAWAAFLNPSPYLIIPAAGFGAAGIYYLWKGSVRLKSEESRGR